jgi:hypothetical protein
MVNKSAPEKQAAAWQYLKYLDTPESQATWATRLLPIALSKPYVESIFWDRMVDGRGPGLPRTTGLLDESGRSKPVLTKLLSVRRRWRAGNLTDRREPASRKVTPRRSRAGARSAR